MATISPYSEAPKPERALDLREYLSVLRARKWSILVVAALVVASTLFFSFRQTPLYRSESRVLVTSGTSTTQNGAVEEVNIANETELATSFSVARRAGEALGEDDFQALRRNLTVEDAGEETDILVFGYVHSKPTDAQNRVEAFSEGYLDDRYERLLAESQPITDELERLRTELTEVETSLAEAVDETEQITLQSRQQQLVVDISELEQQSEALTPPSQEAVGQVIEPAALPSSPVSPDHIKSALLGLLVGLSLGVGVAFLREHLDEGLRGRDDLEARLGVPVLAVVPRVPSWRAGGPPVLVTQMNPEAPASEAYKTLRTGVLFAAGKQGAKTLLITGGSQEEGKSATTANLGMVLAQAGRRVILVSGDLRRPRLHLFFGEGSRSGLTNVLAGEITPWEAMVRPWTENLRLLPSGLVPGNPAELLGSEAMRHLLTELREAADFVLIDSPPVLAVADAITVAPLVDAVLFVADAHKTSRDSVVSARQQLEQVNANRIGGVLNNLDLQKAGTHQSRYDSFASYHPKEEASASGSEEKRRGLRSVLTGGNR